MRQCDATPACNWESTQRARTWHRCLRRRVQNAERGFPRTRVYCTPAPSCRLGDLGWWFFCTRAQPGFEPQEVERDAFPNYPVFLLFSHLRVVISRLSGGAVQAHRMVSLTDVLFSLTLCDLAGRLTGYSTVRLMRRRESRWRRLATEAQRAPRSVHSGGLLPSSSCVLQQKNGAE